MLSKQGSLGKHEFKVAQKDGLTFCVWQDTKAVMVLSDYHDPTEKGSVKRRKQERNQTEVVVAACLSDYQKTHERICWIRWLDIIRSSIAQTHEREEKKTILLFLACNARCAEEKALTATCIFRGCHERRPGLVGQSAGQAAGLQTPSRGVQGHLDCSLVGRT